MEMAFFDQMGGFGGVPSAFGGPYGSAFSSSGGLDPTTMALLFRMQGLGGGAAPQMPTPLPPQNDVSTMIPMNLQQPQQQSQQGGGGLGNILGTALPMLM